MFEICKQIVQIIADSSHSSTFAAAYDTFSNNHHYICSSEDETITHAFPSVPTENHLSTEITIVSGGSKRNNPIAVDQLHGFDYSKKRTSKKVNCCLEVRYVIENCLSDTMVQLMSFILLLHKVVMGSQTSAFTV